MLNTLDVSDEALADRLTSALDIGETMVEAPISDKIGGTIISLAMSFTVSVYNIADAIGDACNDRFISALDIGDTVFDTPITDEIDGTIVSAANSVLDMIDGVHGANAKSSNVGHINGDDSVD